MPIIDRSGRPAGRPRKQLPPRVMLTPAEEREQLVQIVAKATKADRVAYGRADCYRIAAAIAPTLSPRQRAWLAGGAFGNAMARAVARFEPPNNR
jgi:hypothetical protein